MPKNYSTGNNFHNNNQESRIRSIVQEQLAEFFSDIKTEIQTKIKQIDININQLRANMQAFTDWKYKKQQENHYQQIFKDIQILQEKIDDCLKDQNWQKTKIQQLASFMSRSKSKDKNSLFKKSQSAFNLNNIVFGEQIENQQNIEINKKEKIEPKPPLPPSSSRRTDQKQQRKQKFNFSQTPSSTQTKLQKQENFDNETDNPFLNAGTKNSHHEKREDRLMGELNKNKNSFLRKKSQKKIYTIPEQSIQQSMISTQ